MRLENDRIHFDEFDLVPIPYALDVPASAAIALGAALWAAKHEAFFKAKDAIRGHQSDRVKSIHDYVGEAIMYAGAAQWVEAYCMQASTEVNN